MKSRITLGTAMALAMSAPAFAQDHDHSAHEQAAPAAPKPAESCTLSLETAPGQPVQMACRLQPNQAHDHAQMDDAATSPAPDEHAGHAMPAKGDGPAEGSGTARLPANEEMHSLHIAVGDWMIMAHASASLQYTSISGPRGDDKVYATSMAMLTGERKTSWGRVQLKSMMSLEPAMEARGYPNLFATGETARGRPLVDRQHPHDLFMELAARLDFNIGENASLFLYGGPVGEPALGPSAFMHRASARYNPEPPITHHWFDSTHIVYGVVTAGITTPKLQLEASAFRGAEPDENRWDIETPKLDSWSVRATWTPSPAWAAQVSYGQIKQPEALHPGEDEHRTTASVHYNNGRGFSAMAAFSAKNRQPGDTLTAWLAEASWNLDGRNTLFGRVENVANDELFADHHHPVHDQVLRVTKFQAGYARRIPLGPVELALGGAVSAYAKPTALDPYYGRNPIGYTLFARINLGH